MEPQPDKEAVISALNSLIEKVDSLEEWNRTNAYKLSEYNRERHSYSDDVISLGVMHPTSWAFQSDETNKEIGLANSSPNSKRDIGRIERYYENGKKAFE